MASMVPTVAMSRVDTQTAMAIPTVPVTPTVMVMPTAAAMPTETASLRTECTTAMDRSLELRPQFERMVH